MTISFRILIQWLVTPTTACSGSPHNATHSPINIVDHSWSIRIIIFSHSASLTIISLTAVSLPWQSSLRLQSFSRKYCKSGLYFNLTVQSDDMKLTVQYWLNCGNKLRSLYFQGPMPSFRLVSAALSETWVWAKNNDQLVCYNVCAVNMLLLFSRSNRFNVQLNTT